METRDASLGRRLRVTQGRAGPEDRRRRNEMADTASRQVLLTGATGSVASQLLPAFRERYDLRLTDVRASDRGGAPVEGVRVHDLVEADEGAIRGLLRGCDAVVHLGYHSPS